MADFNPKTPITLQVNVSSVGLAAALLQNQLLMAFPSKTLTGLETRYSNIEREIFEVVFGLERFHHFIWGHKVIVYSNQKPPESVATTNCAQAQPRLARMLLKVEVNDFKIKYSRDKTVLLADYLSQSYGSQYTHTESTPKCISNRVAVWESGNY